MPNRVAFVITGGAFVHMWCGLIQARRMRSDIFFRVPPGTCIPTERVGRTCSGGAVDGQNKPPRSSRTVFCGNRGLEHPCSRASPEGPRKSHRCRPPSLVSNDRFGRWPVHPSGIFRPSFPGRLWRGFPHAGVGLRPGHPIQQIPGPCRVSGQARHIDLCVPMC